MNEFLNKLTLVSPQTIWAHQTTRSAIIALLILAGFFLLAQLVGRWFFPFLERMVRKTGDDYSDKMLGAFCGPIQWLILISGLYLALRYLPLDTAADALILGIFRSLIIAFLAWGLYALAKADSPLSLELQRKFALDGIIIAFFSKIARFIILALMIVVIAQEWGYDVNGFIAGLGLGGLAFALAAKDALANIFGGVVIILEKPFVSGDWITTSTIDGTVETITFRTTRIRGFDDSLILVPNATLANESIVNNTRRGKRLVSFYLQVTYETTRLQLDQCLHRIENMLKSHSGVHPQTIMVYFENFAENGLGIKIYFYTITTIWAKHLAVRENINFKIMEILEDMGISFALPSRTIYIEAAPTDGNQLDHS